MVIAWARASPRARPAPSSWSKARCTGARVVRALDFSSERSSQNGPLVTGRRAGQGAAALA